MLAIASTGVARVVTARYLRRLAKNHENHAAEIDRTIAAGRRPTNRVLKGVS
jgi:hypothetical protein